MKLWLCLVLLAGCDRVFKLDELPDAPGSATSDATDAPVDMPPPFCDAPLLVDDFSANTLPYCPWGTAYGDTMLQHDSVLDITLPGTSATMTGCSTGNSYPFTAGGVIMHVAQVNDVTDAYTTMTVRGSGYDAAVVYKAGSLRFGSSMEGYALVTGPAPAWWRLRAIDNQTEAMISDDGVAWISIGKVAVPPPVVIDVDIGTGLDVAPTMPGGEAQLSLFAICN